MEPNKIPPFPQDGILPEVSTKMSSEGADSARASLLEAIETARKALEALPVSPTEVVDALEAAGEAPIAPPVYLKPQEEERGETNAGEDAEAAIPPGEVPTAEEDDTEGDEGDDPGAPAADADTPEKRAAYLESLSNSTPVEIRYWRRAQIDAMNEDLASAFEEARAGGKQFPPTAPLTFSEAPVSGDEPDEDELVPKEFLSGGNDSKGVVLPS